MSQASGSPPRALMCLESYHAIFALVKVTRHYERQGTEAHFWRTSSIHLEVPFLGSLLTSNFSSHHCFQLLPSQSFLWLFGNSTFLKEYVQFFVRQDMAYRHVCLFVVCNGCDFH